VWANQLWIAALELLAQRSWSKHGPCWDDEVIKMWILVRVSWYHEHGFKEGSITAYPKSKVKKKSGNRRIIFYSEGEVTIANDFVLANWLATTNFGLLDQTSCRDAVRWKASPCLVNTIRNSMCQGLPCRRSFCGGWIPRVFPSRHIVHAESNCEWYSVGKTWKEKLRAEVKKPEMDN